MSSFVKNNKIVRHSDAVAAGTTVITPSAGIDVSGFKNVSFLAAFGAITATAVTSIEVHESSDDSTYTALAGSKVTVTDAEDNKIAVVEIIEPSKRYLKCVVNRATANAVLDGIIAILSDAKSQPITASTTTVGNEVHHSPAAGTA